jgi:hypothetical protein
MVVHNRARVPANIMKEAQAIVDRIYSVGGVQFDWHSSTSSDAPLGGHKVSLVILPAAEARRIQYPPDALGFTPGLGSLFGRLAYIIEPRVMAVSRGYGVQPAVVMGTAIAHELGHILLSTGHTRDGLMRREYNQRDFRRVINGQITLTASQVGQLRARFTDEPTDGERLARMVP